MNIEKKTVVFLCPILNSGGIQTLLIRKTRWLVKNGFKVILITTSCGILHKLFKEAGAKIVVCDEIKDGFYNYLFINFMNTINKIIQHIENVHDIFVIEAIDPYTSIYGIILSKLLNAKFITGVYHPSAYCKGFELKNQDFKKLIQFLDSKNLIFYMNEEVLKSHEKFYDMTFNNRNIIHLPIDKFNDSYENKIKIKEEKFKILSIGRLVDFKGYVYGLIEDFEKILKINNNCELIIIGDGPEKKNIIKFAKKTQAYKKNKIIFKGDVEYGKLHSFIIDSNVVIGMGTVILESTALGIPSITAPAYSINNICNDITYKDIYNLGEKKNKCNLTYFDIIKEIMSWSKEEYISNSKLGIAKVKEIYSIDSIMKKWVELVDRLSDNWNIDMELDVWDNRSLLKAYLVCKYKKIKEKINIR